MGASPRCKKSINKWLYLQNSDWVTLVFTRYISLFFYKLRSIGGEKKVASGVKFKRVLASLDQSSDAHNNPILSVVGAI